MSAIIDFHAIKSPYLDYVFKVQTLSLAQRSESDCTSVPPELAELHLGVEDEDFMPALNLTWYMLALKFFSGNAALVSFKESVRKKIPEFECFSQPC